ncbi:hypothetical protein M422DRAFT_244094 [Sphaerobolus stellatus SS14]|nr:hypothetical protein M422DRAFT_244094 [Sphaerobolus stellatus SS14]
MQQSQLHSQLLLSYQKIKLRGATPTVIASSSNEIPAPPSRRPHSFQSHNYRLLSTARIQQQRFFHPLILERIEPLPDLYSQAHMSFQRAIRLRSPSTSADPVDLLEAAMRGMFKRDPARANSFSKTISIIVSSGSNILGHTFQCSATTCFPCRIYFPFPNSLQNTGYIFSRRKSRTSTNKTWRRLEYMRGSCTSDGGGGLRRHVRMRLGEETRTFVDWTATRRRIDEHRPASYTTPFHFTPFTSFLSPIPLPRRISSTTIFMLTGIRPTGDAYLRRQSSSYRDVSTGTMTWCCVLGLSYKGCDDNVSGREDEKTLVEEES